MHITMVHLLFGLLTLLSSASQLIWDPDTTSFVSVDQDHKLETRSADVAGTSHTSEHGPQILPVVIENGSWRISKLPDNLHQLCIPTESTNDRPVWHCENIESIVAKYNEARQVTQPCQAILERNKALTSSYEVLNSHHEQLQKDYKTLSWYTKVFMLLAVWQACIFAYQVAVGKLVPWDTVRVVEPLWGDSEKALVGSSSVFEDLPEVDDKEELIRTSD